LKTSFANGLQPGFGSFLPLSVTRGTP
jgi:hypothetical protein